MSADASRPRPVVLVIDDEQGVRESFRVIFEGEFEVLEADEGAKDSRCAHAASGRGPVDVRMPGRPPDFLPQILPSTTVSPVILVTAVKDVRTAVEPSREALTTTSPSLRRR